ncbi:MAG: hypothetical protein IKB94_00370 [Clostridia bacterium]|nr:hypothetical protein [Clostridia bacterium]
MEAIINFLNEYGILSAIITAVASALGVLVKKLWDKTVGNKVKEDTKKDVAALVVRYVEQVYKDIHGEEKLDKALEAFSDMLSEKGITISDLEMRVYLESALAGFNGAFSKTGKGDTAEAVG